MGLQEILEKLFKVDSNTSATLLITLIVFALGYVITGTVKGFEKYFERKANRELLVRNLQNLLSSLQKRKEVLDIQLRVLDIRVLKEIPLNRIQFFQGEILNSIGQKALFESFFYGPENIFRPKKNKYLRNKSFLKIYENMANILFWENTLYEQMQMTHKELVRENEEYHGPALREIREFYVELFHKSDFQNLQERVFIDEIEQTIKKWEKLPDKRNAFIVNQFSTKPMQEICNRHISLNTARQLKNMLMESEHHYGSMEILIRAQKIGLQNYEHAINYFRRSTKVIIRILS